MDATRDKQSWKKVEHLNRVLNAMISIHQLIAREKDNIKLLQGVCQQFVDSRGYHDAWIALLDGSNKLKLVAQSGLGKFLPPVSERIKSGQLTNCLQMALSNPHAVLCVDRESVCVGCPLSGIGHDRGVMSVRLEHSNIVYGLLTVSMHKDLQADTNEQTLVRELAGDIGYALRKMDLEKERQRSLRALKSSEEFSSNLLSNAPNPILVINADTSIRYVNPAFVRLTGFTYSAIRGAKVPYPWWSEENRDKLERDLRLGMRSGLRRVEELFKRNNGEQFWVELTLVPVKSRGQLKYYVSNWIDITERKRFEETLRFYVKQVTIAQEEERKRIARELHDETAQSISTLYNDIDNILMTHGELPAEVSEQLEQLEVKLDKILEEVRRFSHEMRPGLLDQFGLVPSLEHLIEEFGKSENIECHLEITGNEQRQSPGTEVVLYRIVQEALHNIRKHAEATEVTVSVEYDSDKLTLGISDNGRGFEVPLVLSSLSRKGKLGLIGMEERTGLVNGELQVESRRGHGTSIIVRIPTADSNLVTSSIAVLDRYPTAFSPSWR
jgi:two-component system sensor histidine kinase DegS